MELRNMETTEAPGSKHRGILDVPSERGADPMAAAKGRKPTADRLVNELTDYICGHVTKSLKPIQEVIEKKIIIRALQEAGGSQKEAAKILGIKYTTLNYKVKKHKICIKKIITAGRDFLSNDSGRIREKGFD